MASVYELPSAQKLTNQGYTPTRTNNNEELTNQSPSKVAVIPTQPMTYRPNKEFYDLTSKTESQGFHSTVKQSSGVPPPVPPAPTHFVSVKKPSVPPPPIPPPPANTQRSERSGSGRTRERSRSSRLKENPLISYSGDKISQLKSYTVRQYKGNCNWCTTITAVILVALTAFFTGLIFFAIGAEVTRNDILDTDKCGVPVVKPDVKVDRILSAPHTIPYSWPWLVQIRKRSGEILCVGSILNKEYILTTAHCVDGFPASELTIYAGKYDVQEELSQQIRRVEEITIHEDWSRSTYQNNIALLLLEQELRYTALVSRMCITDQDPGIGESCWVASWGNRHGGKSPSKLNQAIFPINKCPADTTSGLENIICAGRYGRDRGKRICKTDDGAPLNCKSDDGRWYGIGLVSGLPPKDRQSCIGADKPVVYTRISEYRYWISDVTGVPFPKFIT